MVRFYGRFGYAVILNLLLVSLSWAFGELMMPASRGGGGSGWNIGGETYNSRVKVTTDNTVVDSALSNFPVHLQIDSSAGISGDNMQTILDELCGGDDNGESRKYKVAVTNSGGSQLKVEAVNVYCNSGSGEWADYWFEADSISSSAGTDFYFYWDPDTTDNTSYVGSITQNETNANAVWDGLSAVMVHHLNGADATGTDDSSSSANDTLTTNGSPDFQQTGQLGYGINFVKASNESLVISDNSGLSFGDGSNDSPFSIFAIVKPDSTVDSSIACIIDKQSEYQMYSNQRKNTLIVIDSTAYEWADASAYTSGSFMSLGISYSGVGGESAQTEIYPYVNGAADSNSNGDAGTYVAMAAGAANVLIGDRSGYAWEWDGIIDEVFMFSQELTAAEQKGLHNSAMDTLLEYSTIETNP